MDVKIAFLNGELEEDIYMQQPKGFIEKGQEHMVCWLHRSIYGLKKASRSWNIRFDQVIKSYGFEKSPDKPCVYKWIQGTMVVILILDVDDILPIGNSVKVSRLYPRLGEEARRDTGLEFLNLLSGHWWAHIIYIIS